MRNYKDEAEKRVRFIRSVISESGAGGIVYANSGGKDCTLVGILCKMACDNTLGLIMPCASRRNYESDKADAEKVAGQYGITTRLIDLTDARNVLYAAVGGAATVVQGGAAAVDKAAEVAEADGDTAAADGGKTTAAADGGKTTAAAGMPDSDIAISSIALSNIAPRLRMIALYTVAASENRLVAGTGNRSEAYMGYFTKWGDGAYDFNPIADLTVTEIYEFLGYLGAPGSVISKAPSAGLYEGQTDEGEMGVTYRSIDSYLLTGAADGRDIAIIEKFHAKSGHKRQMPIAYSEGNIKYLEAGYEHQ